MQNKKIKEKEFKLLPNSGILSAPVYKGGEQPDLSKHEIIKLNSNENPLGPSKLATDALKNSFDSYLVLQGDACIEGEKKYVV